MKHGRLTLISFARFDKYGNKRFVFQCDCGKKHESNIHPVKYGKTKSCGCLRRELLSDRVMKKSKKISHKGITLTIPEWSRKLGVKKTTLWSRAKLTGWGSHILKPVLYQE